MNECKFVLMNINLKFFALALWLLISFGLFTNEVAAQTYQQVTEVPVFVDDNQLKSAWAGGINAPQICEADVNNDGVKDIFIFDRESKRNFTFVYIDGEYVFKPSYALSFPEINSWVILSDYNCDGINDVITHGFQGAPQTFKGFYIDNVLHFEADKASLFYEGSSGFPINLYSVSTHRPMFKDVNGDGDKDFLAFDVSLSRISYYENLRIENGIPCDSIYFDRVDRCWGNFKETGGITLDLIIGDTCDGKFSRISQTDEKERRHPGGTVFDLYDEDGNGVFDMIFGDATFDRINYVSNNGSADVANFYAQDDSFPSYDEMVKMAIFPAPYLLDIDKDGDEDILAAPFNNGAIENFQNIWFYENDGSNSKPFSLQQKDFIVGDMIDVGEFSDPTFFDENGDGLLDLVIGTGGYLSEDGNYLNSLTLYRNVGTNNAPAFKFIDDNFLDLNALIINKLTPTFGDIDGDNDDDLICGELEGRLLVMDNNNGNFQNPRFLKDNNNVVIDVIKSSDPELFDFNNDNLLDLVIGSRDGNVYYYENTGTANNFDFTFRTDSLGKVTSRENQALGYSSPTLGDFNNDGNTDLLLGGFNEVLKFYSNIGTDYNATFTLNNANFLNETNISTESAQGVDPKLKPTNADISGNGSPEIIVGISNGGLLLYSQDTTIQDTSTAIAQLQNISDQIQVYPNPTNSIINIFWNNTFNKSREIELNIFNVVGKLVRSEKISNQNSMHKISIADLSNGIYLLSLAQDNKLGSTRVVKY